MVANGWSVCLAQQETPSPVKLLCHFVNGEQARSVTTVYCNHVDLQARLLNVIVTSIQPYYISYLRHVTEENVPRWQRRYKVLFKKFKESPLELYYTIHL